MRRVAIGMAVLGAWMVAVASTGPAAQTAAPQGGGQAGRGAGAAGRGAAQAPAAPRGGGNNVGGGSGPDDKPAVDAAAADRGKKTWAAECINCHGTQARGTDNGPNLVRSLTVLHDRFGSTLGPFLKAGHKMQSGSSGASLTDDQVIELAHFLRQRLNDTLRGSPIFTVQDVVTGDAKAGADFFNGPGKCTTCHSATGDLAGMATRYDPVTVQQRFLFPPAARGRGAGTAGRAGAPLPTTITVTVTPASGPAISGVLIQMDDFMVSLRDAAGATRTFKRTPSLTVVKTDPLTTHHQLLDTVTDKNIHDVVAYLETLK